MPVKNRFPPSDTWAFIWRQRLHGEFYLLRALALRVSALLQTLGMEVALKSSCLR